MFRVELTEKTIKYGDIERISSPCKDLDEIKNKVDKFYNDFKEEIQSGKYYIKVAFYNITF